MTDYPHTRKTINVLRGFDPETLAGRHRDERTTYADDRDMLQHRAVRRRVRLRVRRQGRCHHRHRTRATSPRSCHRSAARTAEPALRHAPGRDQRRRQDSGDLRRGRAATTASTSPGLRHHRTSPHPRFCGRKTTGRALPVLVLHRHDSDRRHRALRRRHQGRGVDRLRSARRPTSSTATCSFHDLGDGRGTDHTFFPDQGRICSTRSPADGVPAGRGGRGPAVRRRVPDDSDNWGHSILVTDTTPRATPVLHRRAGPSAAVQQLHRLRLGAGRAVGRRHAPC